MYIDKYNVGKGPICSINFTRRDETNRVSCKVCEETVKILFDTIEPREEELE